MFQIAAGFLLGIGTGVVTSIFTGIALPLLILICFATGVVSSFPYFMVSFVVTTSIINLILTTITAQYTHVNTTETNIYNFKRKLLDPDADEVSTKKFIFERARDLRGNFNERIKGILLLGRKSQNICNMLTGWLCFQ